MKKNQLIIKAIMALALMMCGSNLAYAQFGSLKNVIKREATKQVNDAKRQATHDILREKNEAERKQREAAKQKAEAAVSETVSETTGVSSSESSSSSKSVNYQKENISGAKQSAWTISSPQSELVANVKYYAERMQNSFDKGYKGLDYEAYNMVRFTFPSVVDVLKSTARSDYDNAVNDPVKMLDNVTLNFLKIATNGMPVYKYGEDGKEKYIEQLNFLVKRAGEVSGQEAKAFFFDEVWDILKMRTEGSVKLEGGEAGLSQIESFLQQNVGSVPEAYKYRYPATLNLASAKQQYNTPNFKPKQIAQLRAYKQAEADGKYGKMPASANPSLEKKAISEVNGHRSYWGKAKQAWVGPITSTKKDIHGKVVTQYRSVKVLCEDQGYKVIHNFAVYVKPADGSFSMTGFGWENGDQEIELVK